MKKLIFVFAVLMGMTTLSFAQKFVTKSGKISFYSHTPMEDISGVNNAVSCALDATSGEFVFKVLMKSFKFEKALMEEHFNENYVESDKFPNATFKGKISNLSDVNFKKDGKYNVTVDGDLTIHGVTKKVSEKGTLEVKGGKVITNSVFKILLSDYDIKIPAAVTNNISKTIEITVASTLDKMDK